MKMTRQLQLLWLICLSFIWFTSYSGPKLEPVVVTPQQIEKANQKHGFLAARRLTAWQNLVTKSAKLAEQDKLKSVNRFFNDVPYARDHRVWNRKDYWATPIEFLSRDAGDCEDYSIAKYYTLRALGVPENKLYITYVKALRLNEAHMVLAYYPTPNAIPLILDNINRLILPATKRTDLLPVYSFNGSGLWITKSTGKGKPVSGGSGRLKAWNELQARMAKE